MNKEILVAEHQLWILVIAHKYQNCEASTEEIIWERVNFGASFISEVKSQQRYSIVKVTLLAEVAIYPLAISNFFNEH